MGWPILTNGAELRAVWGDDFEYVRDDDRVLVRSSGDAHWTDRLGQSTKLCSLTSSQLAKLLALRGVDLRALVDVAHQEPTDSELHALGLLIDCAKRRSGQSAKCADFLLAWWNGHACGGFDLAHLWGVDVELRNAMVLVFGLVARLPQGTYLDAALVGSRRDDVDAILATWRADESEAG